MPKTIAKSDSYEALLWDVVTNAHRYIPAQGHRVLDLGAHFGMFSLYCASRGCDVTAYEPTPATFGELLHTAAVAKEIGMGKITAINAAVWVNDGGVTIFDHMETTGANSAFVKDGQTHRTWFRSDSVTLKQALRGSDWDCVKVDIEGAEHGVLMTADSADFKQIKFLTMEIHNDILPQSDRQELLRRLDAEFLFNLRIPVKIHGVPTDDVASIFCWR